MRRQVMMGLLLMVVAVAEVGAQGEKGRKVEGVVMFDTKEADEICAALQVFPPEHPINVVVEKWPVHPNSKAMVDSVGANKPLRYNTDMAFVLVPPDQKRVPVKVGRSDASHVEILEGLAAGISYVTGNAFILKAEAGKNAAAHSH